MGYELDGYCVSHGSYARRWFPEGCPGCTRFAEAVQQRRALAMGICRTHGAWSASGLAEKVVGCPWCCAEGLVGRQPCPQTEDA